MKLRLLTLTAGTVMLAGLLAACGDTTTNTNSANGVTNMGANNANVGAIVVNNNTNMTNMDDDAWDNAANVNRADYDRDRARYERDRGESVIGTGPNDSWLWFKTRAALMAEDNIRESTVNVDVENEVVTLRGTVASAAEKTRAVAAAKGVEGVKSVRDQLKIAPEDSMTNMSTDNSNSNANDR